MSDIVQSPDTMSHLVDRPLLTIIVTVYNKMPRLQEMLESLRLQHARDIEILCIDDASTDGSAFAIDLVVSEDGRFRVVHHDENRGTHLSRIEGIELAAGRYIWIVDGDDAIGPDVCEGIRSIIDSKSPDIIHLGSEVVGEGFLDKGRVDRMREFVKPHKGWLRDTEVFSACFIDGSYRFNMWNKVFSADLVKRAAERMERIILTKAQDKYEYFVISSMASSYLGVPKLKGYEYHFGAGSTGHNELDAASFSRYASMSETAEAISRYASKNCLHAKGAEKAAKELLEDCSSNWFRVVSTDRPRCLDMMAVAWGPVDTVSGLAKFGWSDPGSVALSVRGAESLARRPRKIHSIAVYYHRMNNGGVQRVISEQIRIWVEMGYNVVLITDEGPNSSDYPIPSSVRRFSVQSYNSTDAENYSSRAKDITEIIRRFDIDLFFNHAWVANTLLWDQLVCRLSGTMYVTQCHNMFALMARIGFAYFAMLPPIYAIMDGVAVLSDVDRKYWSQFNPYVVEMYNPLSHIFGMPAASLDSDRILWIGRLSNEKRPLEAIKIFEEVHRMRPSATLDIVGDGPEMDVVRKAAVFSLASAAIKVDGFEKDVSHAYLSSSIVLITSDYEGFLLTLAESMCAGVPVVMYDLPYLRLVREGTGFITVPQGDCSVAAATICDLLEDRTRLRNLGAEGRRYMAESYPHDYSGEWRFFFDGLSVEHPDLTLDETTALMWSTLLDSYRKGVAITKGRLDSLMKTRSYCIWSFVVRILRRMHIL